MTRWPSHLPNQCNNGARPGRSICFLGIKTPNQKSSKSQGLEVKKKKKICGQTMRFKSVRSHYASTSNSQSHVVQLWETQDYLSVSDCLNVISIVWGRTSVLSECNFSTGTVTAVGYWSSSGPAASGGWGMYVCGIIPRAWTHCCNSFEMTLLIRSNVVYSTPYFVITDGACRRFWGRKANMYLEYMSPPGRKFFLLSMTEGVQCSQLAPRGCPLENGATSGA